MNRLGIIWSLAFALLAQPALAIGTPRMSEPEMTAAADIVVEGTITHVALLKRWIGTTPGVDTGYEHGEFLSTLKITKSLKGDLKPGADLKFFVSAYMEGTWDNPPPLGFVYDATQDAVTPDTSLRVFLKWNPTDKRYERIHFNSGFIVLKKSPKPFPKNENVE